MKNFTLKKVSVLTAGLILFGLLSAAKAQTNYQIDEAATAASPLKPGTRIAMYYAGRDKETNQSIVRIFQGVTTQGLYLVQEFYHDRLYDQQAYTQPYLIMPKEGLENVRDRTDIHDYDGVTIVGVYTRLYPGGGLWSRGNYSQGVQDGLWQDWFSNGQLAQEIHYLHGKKNGVMKTWFYKGQQRSECTYVEGQKHGSWQEWHPNGALHSTGQYVHDKQEGPWPQWYRNGIKSVEAYYKNGLLQGTYLTWHENGKPYLAGTFERGVPIGLWQEWDQQGQLLYAQKLENSHKLESSPYQ